jgi:deoxyribodipyrimidine photolyase-related protein
MDPAIALILGDQLSMSISALEGRDRASTIVLMCEVDGEARYVPHHKKKIAFVFAAMRHFAIRLRLAGWMVDYVKLDDPGNTGSLAGEVARAMVRHTAETLTVTEPGEWRLREDMRTWRCDPVVLQDNRFLCSHEEFGGWASGRSSLRMEYFYRDMRRKSGLLMDRGKPEGGQWNFDHDNRKRPDPNRIIPQPLRFVPDAETRSVLDLVGDRFGDHFGALDPFWLPVTQGDAERAADHFFEHCLPHFGDYQDAMLTGQRFLYHSVLSPLINVGLLDPMALCRRAERTYQEGHAPLNAVEGFIRQIIGWREYVRGIYWRMGPDYVRSNALGARRNLPALYWTGATGMACMAAAIDQTREDAYAHHIQRLMVTGNFALLAGVDPHQVHEWYLAVYADAYEWVEVPNTIGMSQFADGGLLGSKPYAASGAYIDRMSDYCRGCRYSVKEKTGDNACPFNALYWHFLARHRSRFEANPRMAQMYRTYDRMTDDHRGALAARAETFLQNLDRTGSDL